MSKKSGASGKKPSGTPARNKKPKLNKKWYEKELHKQVEMCKLQARVKHKQLRVIVVFEGGRGWLVLKDDRPMEALPGFFFAWASPA